MNYLAPALWKDCMWQERCIVDIRLWEVYLNGTSCVGVIGGWQVNSDWGRYLWGFIERGHNSSSLKRRPVIGPNVDTRREVHSKSRNSFSKDTKVGHIDHVWRIASAFVWQVYSTCRTMNWGINPENRQRPNYTWLWRPGWWAKWDR